MKLEFHGGYPCANTWCTYLGHGAHRDVYEGHHRLLGDFVPKLELKSKTSNGFEATILQERPAPWDKFGENLPVCLFYGDIQHHSETRRGANQLSCLVVQHCGKALDKNTPTWQLTLKSYAYLEAVTWQTTEIIAKVQARNGVACDMHFGNLAVTPGLEDWEFDSTSMVRPPLQIRIVDAEGLHAHRCNRSEGESDPAGRPHAT